jgi:glycosyltransferase involved in cell wall biosynthesis
LKLRLKALRPFPHGRFEVEVEVEVEVDIDFRIFAPNKNKPTTHIPKKMNPPSISIITVVYNSVSLLEVTMQSVFDQDYPYIEYIVVDGGSTDGSVLLIQKYEQQISRWISEPDRGLYDAMNKGMDMATGDFIWFMNAGDALPEKDTVSQLMALCQADTDVLYGEVMLVNEGREPIGTRSDCTTQRLPESLCWQSLRYGMVVCHQGFIPRKNKAPKYRMNNLSADIQWVIECLKKSRRTTHSHLILANYLMGGLSKNRHQQSLKDRYRILQQQYGYFPNLLAHAWILIRALYAKYVLRKKYI